MKTLALLIAFTAALSTSCSNTSWDENWVVQHSYTHTDEFAKERTFYAPRISAYSQQGQGVGICHFWLAGGSRDNQPISDFTLIVDCQVALAYFSKALTEDGVELEISLVKSGIDPTFNSIDQRFNVKIPEDLLRQKRNSGFRIRLYSQLGTQDVHIERKYINGFLRYIGQ